MFSISELEMQPKTDSEWIAEKIISGILADITDRAGLQNTWESIDAEIQQEILQQWKDIIVGVLDEPND